MGFLYGGRAKIRCFENILLKKICGPGLKIVVIEALGVTLQVLLLESQLTRKTDLWKNGFGNGRMAQPAHNHIQLLSAMWSLWFLLPKSVIL
jgi:hypothetical protein